MILEFKNENNKYLLKTSLLYKLTILFLFVMTISTNTAHATTEFVSSIQESGGDYSSLFAWEADVQTDLTHSGTAVYSGSITGTLTDGVTLELFRGGTYQNATSTLVATTSTQLLVENYSGLVGGESYVLTDGDQWRIASSSLNMFTVSGTGTQLGDDPIAVSDISGTWSSADNTAVTIDGWTTSATNYIKIYTTGDARHAGVWDDTKYRLSISSNSGTLVINSSNVKIEGLQIEISTGAYDNRIGIFLGNNATYAEISKNIIKNGNTSTTGRRGISVIGIGPFYVWDNIIYESLSIAVYVDTASGKFYFYNNTVINSNMCIRSEGGTDIVAKNNITQSCTDGYVGIFDSSSDYNISDIVADAPGANSLNSTTVSFVSTTSGSEDLHLSPSDTSAKDAGTDLIADANLAFTTDIDGDTRSGSWDIGADEYVAVVVEAVDTSPSFSLTQLYSPKISNVLINNITDNSAEITFDTDKDGNTQVLYGTEAFYNMFHSFSHIEFSWDEVKNHKAVLSDLKPSTTYYFTIKSKGPSNTGIDDNVYMFDTLGTETVSETTQATTTETTTTTTTTTTTDNTTVVTETTTTTEVTGGETENQKQIDFLKSQITSFAEILRDTISKFRERLKEQSIKIQNQASVINSDIFGVLKIFFRK